MTKNKEFENGDKYEGEMNNGKMEGQGIYTFKNGERYEGEFKNDMFDGLGEYYFTDGTIKRGIYKEDEIVGGPNAYALKKAKRRAKLRRRQLSLILLGKMKAEEANELSKLSKFLAEVIFEMRYLYGIILIILIILNIIFFPVELRLNLILGVIAIFLTIGKLIAKIGAVYGFRSGVQIPRRMKK